MPILALADACRQTADGPRMREVPREESKGTSRSGGRMWPLLKFLILLFTTTCPALLFGCCWEDELEEIEMVNLII